MEAADRSSRERSSSDGWLLDPDGSPAYDDGVSPLDTSVERRYYGGVIRSFRCRETKRIFDGEESPAFPLDIQDRARQKLRMLDAARGPQDLYRPPGNRFEALQGDRRGEYSIRINRQWRICFRWENGAEGVRIEDYH
jgi:toxin HigB-1